MMFWRIIICICNLNVISNINFNSPFYFQSNSTFFQLQESFSSKITLLTVKESDHSKFSISIRRNEEFSKFSLINNNYKVLIYPNLMNPILNHELKDLKVNIFCKFFYPIIATANNVKYRCEIFYIDQHSNNISIGTCDLSLLKTSCFCTVSGIISLNKLMNANEVVYSASVFSCSEMNCVNSQSWKPFVNTTSHVQLRESEKLIWVNAFHNVTYGVGLLMGLPRHSIDRALGLELPLRIVFSNNKRRINSLRIKLTYNPSLTLESYEQSSNMNMKNIHDDAPESGPVMVIILQLSIIEKNFIKPSEFNLTYRFNIKEIMQPLQFSANIEQISFENNNQTIQLQNNWKNFEVPIKETDNTIIPVINIPSLVSNFNNDKLPYVWERDSFKLYALANGASMDITDQVQCRSFNESLLKCPEFMQPFKDDILNHIHNKMLLDWSVEVKMPDWKMILDVRPQLVFENVWNITISDQVLNKLSDWKGVITRSSTGSIDDYTCENLYQMTSVNIFQRATMFNEATQVSKTVFLDVTKNMNLSQIEIIPNYTKIYRYGNQLMIQGTKNGSAVLKILDSQRQVLIAKDIIVVDTKVKVVDLDVTCISNVNVFSTASHFSFSINIHKLSFNFTEFNISKKCLLIIDLIFSDKSRVNLFTLSSDQFSLRFITNLKIFDVNSLEDMYYSYQKFNNAIEFDVEISEPKFCQKYQVIFKKHVLLKLNFTGTTISKPSSYSSISFLNITTPAMITNVTSDTKAADQKPVVFPFTFINLIIFFTCGCIVLGIIIIIFKFGKPCTTRNRNNSTLKRRKRSILQNGDTSPGKILFGSDYPPLLPSPGPPIGIIDNMKMTISSPQSFWCLHHKNNIFQNKKSPFTRQFSLPLKGFQSKSPSNNHSHNCSSKWSNKRIPEEMKMNVYSSQEDLNITPLTMPESDSQMCWSATQMDTDYSSGVGSLMTNFDDFLKDPYEAKDRFSQLSEIPRLMPNRKENVYEAI